jgi:phage terminase large subunit
MGIDYGRALFEQEYYCSFTGAMIGAYFGAELARVERENRLCDFDIDWNHPVHTAWDLGKSANNPIWCFQVIAGEPRIVDFYQPESDDLADWVKWLDDKGYRGNDYVPHDIMATEWGSRRTRFDVLQGCKRHPIRLPMVSVADGLQAGRTTINEARFRDTERVRDGFDGLKNYRRDWDDDKKTFRETPVKDWAEHIGSAFRYLGLAWRAVTPPRPQPVQPRSLQFEAQPDGRIVANMSVKEIVERKMKARRSSQ